MNRKSVCVLCALLTVLGIWAVSPSRSRAGGEGLMSKGRFEGEEVVF